MLVRPAALVLAVMLLVTPACSSLPIGGILSALGGSSNEGVQVGTEDITIRKKEEETAVNTQLGSNTETTQTADKIVNTVQNKGLTTFQLILFALLAGWAIPDPKSMGQGFLRLVRAVRGKDQA